MLARASGSLREDDKVKVVDGKVELRGDQPLPALRP
jgi:hypothetical protein